MRLGELLIEAQVITPAQLDEALQAQVMWGARLGTALVELGRVDLDGLSNALGYQQHLPAALASHFDGADRALQRLLSPNHAERFGCIPLRRVGKHAAAVAVAAPLPPRERAIVADELGVAPEKVIIAIAPELRIRYALERIYNIARPQRFLRAPGSARSEPKHLALVSEPLHLDSGPVIARTGTQERRRYLEPLLAPPRTKTGPITTPSNPARDAGAMLDALRTSHRERVAELAIEAVAQLVPTAEAAVLLTPRGEVAVSWTSFRRDGRVLPPLTLPADGALATAVTTKHPQRIRSTAPAPSDRLMFVTLGVTDGELVVTPLVARDRIVAMLVIGGTALDTAVIAAIAAAAAEGFARLMREAIK